MSVTSVAARDTTLMESVEQLGVVTRWQAEVQAGGPYTRTFTAPEWATQVVVEVRLSPEFWNTVTDFGVTLFDRDGAQLGQGPMNYDFNRVTVDLPAKRGPDFPVTLELFPAFARPVPPASFTAAVQLAFVAPPRPIMAARRRGARIGRRSGARLARGDDPAVHVARRFPRLAGPGEDPRGRHARRLDGRAARDRSSGTEELTLVTVRIASGQGFWGDWLEAPVRQVEGGPIDYLMMDYLAEVTMSILQKQKARNPALGYARDVVPLLERILPRVVERGIRVTTNAGGVNPDACATAIVETARKLGLAGRLKVGVVTGDDLLPRLDELLGKGIALAHMETGRPLSEIRAGVLSANAYLGAWPVVEALAAGAQVVITGRVTDTGLTLAPLIQRIRLGHHAAWDLLAAGTIAGHIIECGAQCSGGNYLAGWPAVPGLEDVGYPIVEAEPDGSFTVTKHPNTGGAVTVASVTEQLVYEMGDPREYITPDCVADFTTICLDQAGRDRRAGARHQGPPGDRAAEGLDRLRGRLQGRRHPRLRLARCAGQGAEADRVLRARLERLGLGFDEVLTEFVGYNATHGPLAGAPAPDLPEVQLRVGVRSPQREPVERFTRELAPLILNGPPSVTGLRRRPAQGRGDRGVLAGAGAQAGDPPRREDRVRMSLFGMRPLPSAPAAPVVPHLPDLEDQRRLIARARCQAWRWMLRCVLLIVIAALAFRRGWIALGTACFASSLLGLQLNRSNLKQAAELERKVALLEGK